MRPSAIIKSLELLSSEVLPLVNAELGNNAVAGSAEPT
jgi:hypothetical protein